MEPLKPAQKRAILENQPNAQPADVEEYERLLSQRFTVDPDFAPAAAPAEGGKVTRDSLKDSEDRIAQLHDKLFSVPKAAAAVR